MIIIIACIVWYDTRYALKRLSLILVWAEVKCDKRTEKTRSVLKS